MSPYDIVWLYICADRTLTRGNAPQRDDMKNMRKYAVKHFAQRLKNH